jgi:hypothetical protein
MADRIRFHLDEHVDPAIATALRRAGSMQQLQTKQVCELRMMLPISASRAMRAE